MRSFHQKAEPEAAASLPAPNPDRLAMVWQQKNCAPSGHLLRSRQDDDAAYTHLGITILPASKRRRVQLLLLVLLAQLSNSYAIRFEL